MNGEKRCRDYCTIVAEYRCCYECDKNQECDNYNVSKCYNCDISKQNNYKSITDRHGKITKASKVKEETNNKNNESVIPMNKVKCHIYCEDMNNKYVCCYQCEKRDKCSSINRCNDKCENYINEKSKIIGYDIVSCNTCRKRYKCIDMHKYECKANNYCYYAKEKQKDNKTEEQEIKYICNNKCSITDENVCCRSCNRYDICKDKNELCANYVSKNMSCKSNEMSAKSKEKQKNNKEELIISNSEKATKLLKIECILRDCTIDDLIVNLISDKAKAIYDNVVDK